MKTIARVTRRRFVRLFAIFAAAWLLARGGPDRPAVQAQVDTNPIVTENSQPGSPQNEWDVTGSGDPTIQGFASDISVNKGSLVSFKIKTSAPGFTIDIYRLGYYQGFGARKVGTIVPTSAQIVNAQHQPPCLTDSASGLVDCGNWTVTASWNTSAVTSGIFIAKLSRSDNPDASSHVLFIVRDDLRTSDILFQTSDTTWQAYNQYGGASLYCGGPLDNSAGKYSCPTRGAKVSYNRPFDTRAHDPQSFVFNAEYPMVRWLEANGYDVKYWTGVDTDRFGADPTIGLTGAHRPKAFFSVGHDEYWSAAQRANVERARDGGVNLAFFSGNEMFWKTRYESSLDASGTAYRTLVSYKETFGEGSRVDPDSSNPWTGSWRDPRFPRAGGANPENALTGQLWTVNCCSDRIHVPASMANLRFWRNTGVASLVPGDPIGYRTSLESLGYEWDEVVDNGQLPAGLIRMSLTTLIVPERVTDFGINVAQGSATHSLTLYRHASGALVFGAGTVQWSWGLDAVHDRSQVPTDQATQQATVNLLADMAVQPRTLQVGADPARPLVAAAMSTDTSAPTSTVVAPAAGSSVESGSRVTISGTAIENGGGALAGVELSVDGGATWHTTKLLPSGLWSYEWTPGSPGPATIRSRAFDDSGNVESAGGGVTVTIVPGACPCTSLWRSTTTPTVPSAVDTNPVEIGTKFYSDTDGFITGVRFYKSTANTGTHLGNLWTLSGTLLATVTFANETPSGWQQAAFPSPVPITANTTYVVSYHTNVGSYSADGGYFAGAPIDSPPLHAASSPVAGGNGVFAYGESQFPNGTFNGTNYWVDVVFASTVDDSTPPVISHIKARALDSSRLTITWTTDEEATSKIQYSTDPAILSDATILPPGTQTINLGQFVTQHSVSLSSLTPNTTYFYRVISVDRSGNAANVAAPSVTVPGPTLRDTTSPDFSAGIGAGTYVSETADGELTLAPAVGAEFSGTTLTPGWIDVPYAAGGAAFIGGGAALVDGSRLGTCTVVDESCREQWSLTPGHRLEFVATFTGDAFQHSGFAQDFSTASQPWAIFSTLTGGVLAARTNSGDGSIDTVLGTGFLGLPHKYTIDWNDTSVVYSIDGSVVATHTVAVAGPMRPLAASDFSVFGGNAVIDWMRMSPYAISGTFDSRVFDANTSVDWRTIQWTANTPAGTGIAIALHTGDTADPSDGTWTDWQSIAAPGPLAVSSRYIQYRATLSTNDPNVTPELDDVIISTGQAPVAIDDSIVVAVNGTTSLPASGPGSLIANDSDGDHDPLEVAAVGPASHGATLLNFDGSVRYTPAPNYSGADSFVYTVSDGLLTSSAVVSIDVRDGNIPPVASNDFYTTNEEVTLNVPAPAGILQNDSDADHDPLAAVLVTQPAHGVLELASSGSFTYTPNPDYAGPDVFTYRASDGQAASDPATVQIQVLQVNDPPIAAPDAYTAVLNGVLEVSAPGVLANDHDVEADDTAPLRAQLISGPGNGTLTLNPDGSFHYVPNADFVGLDEFTYAAVDPLGAVGSPATVSMTVALEAISQAVNGGGTVSTGTDATPGLPLVTAVTSPSAATITIAQGVISGSQPPAGYTFLNQQATITILNPDGSELTASAASPIRVALTIDASLLLPGVTEQSLQIFRNGVLMADCVGQPAVPSGLDACVTAREGGSALGNDVRLTVIATHASRWNVGVSTAQIGNAPIARADGDYIVAPQAPLVVRAPGVLGNDYGRAALTAVLSVGSVVGGIVDLAPSGAFTFTPDSTVCPASFRYRASDGASESAEATVSILTNCRPRANDDALTIAEDSGTTSIDVLSNDADPDAGQTLAIISAGTPAHGVASISGGKSISYTPAPDYNGTDSFSYTVSDGRGGTATATVAVTISSVNDRPSFTRGADQTVNEDAGQRTIGGWATNLSAGPQDESGQLLDFLVSNDNGSLFAVQPAIAADGTLTYTPAANVSGSAIVSVRLHDNGGTLNGGVDTSAPVTFVIGVGGVNDPPAFTKGADQVLSGNPGAQTVANWATGISAGPVNEMGQTLTFVVTNNNPALFAVQPSISANGTLTYTPATNVTGTALVTVTLKDNGGVANGGVDTSAAQTFQIAVNKSPTVTTLQSSNTPSLAGVPITLTAAVAGTAPNVGVPGGTIAFKDGAATLATVTLAAGVATFSTSSLAIGTHSLTAVYTPAGNFVASTSTALSQAITASATMKVNFQVHAILDDSKKPKVQDAAVPGAEVRVYTKRDQCTNGVIVSGKPKLWGLIFDGPDGPGGANPGCAPLSYGNYVASGITDANGNVSIIVPPTTSDPNSDYVVIARTTKFDYIKTTLTPDPLYSEKTIATIKAADAKDVKLHQIATFDGKLMPGKDLEEYGSYLGIVEPDFVDWLDDKQQYPVVLVAQGAWGITTNLTPPDGFAVEENDLTTDIADGTGAIQFTLDDFGSDWTATAVNHTITHNGEIRFRSDVIPMFNRKLSKAFNDSAKMMLGEPSVTIPVLANDRMGTESQWVSLNYFTQPNYGKVSQSADGKTLIYTPDPGWSGYTTFVYNLQDNRGIVSSADVWVYVLPLPTVSTKTVVNVTEGNSGATAATATITLSGESTHPITVNYTTLDDSASAGADYIAASGTVTINPGDLQAAVPLQIIGDTLPEANEQFIFRVSAPTNATLGDVTDGIIKILDDDPPVISAQDVTVAEGNVATKVVNVVVKLSQSDGQPVTVNYTTVDGSATAGSDYMAASGTLTFAPGSVSKSIPITIIGDTVGESTEQFYVDLSAPVVGILGQSRATVTITNDDTSSMSIATTDQFAGSVDGGLAIVQTSDGEVTLAPMVDAEFSGSGLPAGWTSAVGASGGGTAVGSGNAIVSGATLLGPSGSGAPRALDITATLTAPNQAIGLGAGSLASPLAVFVVKSDGVLYVRTIAPNTSGVVVTKETAVAGNWLGAPHVFHIDWNAANAAYKIDGTAVGTHTGLAWGSLAMAPMVLDSAPEDGAVAVDWIRLSPYAASGTFSKVFDAGAAAAWTKLATSATVPAGTAVSVSYRTGNTPTPDASWTAFTTLVGTGGTLAGSGQYLELRMQLSTTNAIKTPVVNDFTLTYKLQ